MASSRPAWSATGACAGCSSAGRIEAVVIRDDLVRLAEAPLAFRMADLPLLAPGRRIAIDVLSADELELSVSARFVEALDGTESGLPVEDYLAEESAEEAVEGSAESAAAQADAVSAPASGDACGAPPPAT